MGLERPVYEKKGYNSFVYYVAFGLCTDNVDVYPEQHHVTGIPEGVKLLGITKDMIHADFKGYVSGAFGEALENKDPELAKKVHENGKAMQIMGEVEDDSSLSYLVSSVGIVEALCDMGAIAVLDMHLCRWYTPEEWHKDVFEKVTNPFTHISPMMGKQEDGIWLHTRGMRKFGRPDISISGVPEDDLQAAQEMAQEMVPIQAIGGAWLDKVITYQTCKGDAKLNPHDYYTEGMDNPMYNNNFFDIPWSAVQFEKPAKK